MVKDDILTADAVQKALQTNWLGQNYRYLPQAGSTNNLLKAQVRQDGAPLSGTVVLTDHQTQGRGRMGRTWEAPPGTSLLFSLLLRPGWRASQLGWLTMIAGLAVTEAVEQQSDLNIGLKWPNDGVLWQDAAWRKYCGILLEGKVSASGRLEHAVVGIGVNVNIAKEQLPRALFPATSLLAAQGAPLPRLPLFAAILARFERYYDAADQGESPQRAWQARLLFMGQRVVISGIGRGAELIGTAVGTDESGSLLVRDDMGTLHTVAAGDVSLRTYPH